jgi:hypothetical protein
MGSPTGGYHDEILHMTTITMKQLFTYVRDELAAAITNQDDDRINALWHTFDVLNDAASAVQDGPVAQLALYLLHVIADVLSGDFAESNLPSDTLLADVFG